MSPLEFCYWVQGFAELHQEPPTAEQWKSIREHLELVFQKVTPVVPSRIEPDPFAPLTPPRKPRPFEPWVLPTGPTCKGSGLHFAESTSAHPPLCPTAKRPETVPLPPVPDPFEAR